MPRFSLIVPVYNVERYLPRFLASLDAQTFNRARVEIILVNDGSPDRSGDLLDDWAAERTEARVIHRTNGGLSAARNSGLEEATGEWALFPDPDDELPPEYLATLDAFVTTHEAPAHEAPSFDVIAIPRIVRDERTGKIKDTHPLRAIFLQGDRVVALGHESPEFQLALNSGAVRLTALEATGLRFDERVRPTFEDAHLIGKLLLERGTGLGVCTGTEYLWTRRLSGDSVTQSSWGRRERYDDVFRFGYLDLLRSARSRLGRVPNWLARMVLYDLHWYLRMDRKDSSPFKQLDADALKIFEQHFSTVMDFVEPEHVVSFDLCSEDVVIAGLRAFKEAEFVVVPARSQEGSRGLLEVEYLFRGPRPEESVTIAGESVTIVGVDESVRFFGRERLIRRRLAFPAPSGRPADVLLALDGQPIPIVHHAEESFGRARTLSSFVRRLRTLLRLAREHGRPSSR